MEHESTQSNVISHREQMKQGEVFRMAAMAGYLAAATHPNKVIRTREEREAQQAARAYMDSHPYAPETKLARFFIDTLINQSGADYDNKAHYNAKQLRNEINNVNGHYLDDHDLGAALAITASHYAESNNNGRELKDVDTGLDEKMSRKVMGTVAMLWETGINTALNKMPDACMQYGASYSNNHKMIGPINNSFRIESPGNAAKGHTLTAG